MVVSKIETAILHYGGIGMIYITGDTHGNFARFSKKSLIRQQVELTDRDFVIVCGDFGLCWARDKTFEYNCKLFSNKQYTVLWVSGNHENYDMIEEFPVELWHGGKVRHIVRNKVILLERGQIFEIAGKTFFTFGGAASHDIQGGILDPADPMFIKKKRMLLASGGQNHFRILHESWWSQELPTAIELQDGLRNLENVNYKVDYVITHCCSTSLQNKLCSGIPDMYQPDILTDYFDDLEKKLQFNHWYFGHYHSDINIADKYTLLYHALIPIDYPKALEDITIIGRPRYNYKDTVQFSCGDEQYTGTICVVDAWGTFEQNEEPSYDILVSDCIYKHIRESQISEVKAQ